MNRDALPPRSLPSARPAAPPLAPRVEGYQILELLGEGGMGCVWRAVQLSTKREVALKVVGTAAVGSRRAQQRFEREVELTARLEHPNIARVYDSGVHAGVYFYAAELIAGTPLDEYAERAELSRRLILELMRPVCAAVQHAHQRGVIHRDLKPSNILVRGDGHPYVLDFGLAKATEAAARGDGGHAVSLAGEMAGTPAFMSPEQAAGGGDRVDTRTDVYSLGVILYRLLTGESPHDLSGSHVDVMRRIESVDARRPRAVRAGPDRDLEALLLKALARRVEERYQSVSELLGDIENYLAGRPLVARAPSAGYLAARFVRRHLAQLALVALFAAVVIGWGVREYVRNVRELAESQTKQLEAERQNRKIEASAAEAKSKQREAEQRNAELTLRNADIWAATGKWADAHATYRDAVGQFQALGESTYRADTGLAVAYWHTRPPLTELVGHQGPVRCAATMPDPRRAVTGGADGTVRVWDVATGRCVLLIDARGGAINCVAAAGGVIVAGDERGVARAWDSTSGKVLREFRRHEGAVAVVAVSPDGRVVASASANRRTFVWRVGGEEGSGAADDWSLGADHTSALVFAPDGRRVYQGEQERAELYACDVTGRTRTTIAHGLKAQSLAVSSDGRMLAIGGEVGQVATVRVDPAPATAPVLPDVRGSRPGRVYAIAFAPGDRAIVAVSKDGVVSTWDGGGGGPLGQIVIPETIVRQSALAAGSGWAVTGGDDGVARVWDVAPADEAAEVTVLRGHDERFPGGVDAREAGVNDAVLSPDGRLAASAGKEGRMIVWDVATGRKLFTASSSRWHQMRAVRFSRDGRWLAFSGDEIPYLLDLTAGKAWDAAGVAARLHRLPGDDEIVLALAFAPNDDRLLTGTKVWVRLWEGLPAARQRWVYHSPRGVFIPKLAFVRGGEWALGMLESGRAVAELTNANEPTPVPGLISGDSPMQWVHSAAAAFTADGSRVFCRATSGGLGVYDTLTGELIQAFRGDHADAIFDMAVARGDRWGLTGSRDKTVKMWDMKSGEPIRTFEGHVDVVTAVDLSDDALLVLSGSADTTCRVIDLTRPREYRRFERLLPDTWRRVRADPADPAALEVLGAWHAFRGRRLWATELLVAARAARGREAGETDRGASALTLARGYWLTGDLASARAEFERALARGEAPEAYVRLCLAAVGAGGAPEVAVTNPGDRVHEGDFETAAGYFTGRVERGSLSAQVWWTLALLHLAIDDVGQYRRDCAGFLERFGDPDGEFEATLARLCLLKPDPVADVGRLTALANAGVKKLPPFRDAERPFVRQAVGLAHLRSRRWAAAAEWFEGSGANGPWDADWVVRENQLLLAIAYERLGRHAEAKCQLDEAEAALEEICSRDVGEMWTEWVIAREFLREAKAVVRGK